LRHPFEKMVPFQGNSLKGYFPFTKEKVFVAKFSRGGKIKKGGCIKRALGTKVTSKRGVCSPIEQSGRTRVRERRHQ